MTPHTACLRVRRAVNTTVMSTERDFRFLIVIASAGIIACGKSSDAHVAPTSATPHGQALVADFRVPDLGEIKDSAMRVSVLRGKAILEATRDSLPKNVGNSLRCTSCHFAAGTVANALPWVGVYSRFPQYRSRDARVAVIEDRINDCFLRSLNGRALDPQTREMHDIVAYMAFLSLGVPVGASVRGQGVPKLAKLATDTVRGAGVFTSECARCHGAAGQGSAAAPPLWGPGSYNNGAGMSRISVLAAFAHQLMPFDKPGSLTAQQYYDVAAFVNSRPRPDYAARAKDWPNGDAPRDMGYPLPRGSAHTAAH